MRMRFSLVVMVLVTLAGCGPRTPSEQKVLGPPAGPPGYPRATQMLIAYALQYGAWQELDGDLKSSDEIIRAHALEVVKNAKLSDAGPILLVALNRSVAAGAQGSGTGGGGIAGESVKDRLEPMLDSAHTPERWPSFRATSTGRYAIFPRVRQDGLRS